MNWATYLNRPKAPAAVTRLRQGLNLLTSFRLSEIFEMRAFILDA